MRNKGTTPRIIGQKIKLERFEILGYIRFVTFKKVRFKNTSPVKTLDTS